MKLVTFMHSNSAYPGILTDAGVVDIRSSWQGSDAPASVLDILQRGPDCLKKIEEIAASSKFLMPSEAVKLLAPLPRPPKVLALAGNYSRHVKEFGREKNLSYAPKTTTMPRVFLMPSTVITGPDTVIPWPLYSQTIDYEIELAVVIAKTVKAIEPHEAQNCIAGYTIANDISARSVTFSKNRTKRPWDEFYDWLNGKWADSFLPTGPYILTADEIGDAQNLQMTLKVNGRVRQQANTSEMTFTVSDIVSFISHLMTLEPGDIIATGTPAGVAAPTGDFLQPDDVIEANIEKLGTLPNKMGQRPKDFFVPLAQA